MRSPRGARSGPPAGRNTFHQLATMAISLAMVLQLLSLCVVKPDLPVFFGSTVSTFFSAGRRMNSTRRLRCHPSSLTRCSSASQPEQFPCGLVVADRLDVDVAGLPEQDREDGRADDVALRAGVVARVADREVPAKLVEETGLLEERREEDEPSDGRDALPGRPVDLKAASERGEVDRSAEPPDEIVRLGHLKPERRCVRITHVAFPFFRDLFQQYQVYEKRKRHASFCRTILSSPKR